MIPYARILGVLLVLASGCAAAADIGRVVLAAGDTSALRQGQVVRLALGTLVQDSDVLRTGAASNLQVRFQDDSYVSLRESSELRVDQYRFNEGKGDESAAFSLLKGGLRAVTGLIGRKNHDDYKMVTPTATIGIRGTDYAATYCQGDCRNADGSPAKDGVYGRVIGQSQGTNQIHVSNDAGQRTLGINSNFFVGDRRGGIELLLVAPDFVLSKLESRGRGGSKGESGGTGSEKASSGGASDESRPSTTPEPLPQLAFVATNSLNSQGTPEVLQPANGFLIAFPGKPGFSGDAFFDDNTTIGTFNSQNQLISATGGGRTASLAGGTIVDAGSYTLGNQTFVWGRWTGATSVPVFNGSTFVQTTGVPLLFGTATGVVKEGSVVGQLGGVATYNYVGGPRPVDGAGNVGNITSTSTTINFTTLQQTLSLGMSFPSIFVGASNMGPATFSLSGTGSATTNGGSGEFGGNLSGSCSGGGCLTPSPTGTFSTGLTGTNGYELAPVTGLVNGTQAGEVAFLNLYQSNSFTPGPPPSTVTGQVAWANAAPSVANTATVGGGPVTLSGNNLVAFGNGSTFPSGSLGAGSIIETGSVSLVDGSSMNWGRWTSASQVVSSPGNVTINPATGVPFILGNSPTSPMPTSGTFIFSYAGGPNPVNASGTVGTFGGGAFSVTFGSTSGSMSVSTPLTFSIGAFNYSLSSCTSGCTFTNSSGVAGNMNLNGTCVGGCGPTATANLAGVFVGPQHGGLAVAGNVFATSTPAATIAGAFKR